MTSLRLRNILLSCTDLDLALEFYVGVLGLPIRFRDGSSFAALDTGDVTLALAANSEHPSAGSVILGIRVTDAPDAPSTGRLQAVIGRLEASGATTLSPPAPGRHELRALLRAPDGTLLSLYSPLP